MQRKTGRGHSAMTSTGKANTRKWTDSLQQNQSGKTGNKTILKQLSHTTPFFPGSNGLQNFPPLPPQHTRDRAFSPPLLKLGHTGPKDSPWQKMMEEFLRDWKVQQRHLPPSRPSGKPLPRAECLPKRKENSKERRRKTWTWAVTWCLLREGNSHWLRSYKQQSHRTPGRAAHPPGHSSEHQASGKHDLGEIWSPPHLSSPGTHNPYSETFGFLPQQLWAPSEQEFKVIVVSPDNF